MTERATFYGAIVGDREVWPAADRIAAWLHETVLRLSLIAPMPRATRAKPSAGPALSPAWIKPQLTRLVDEAPTGKGWLHEIKYDGYRMHARIDGDKIQLLTRTGLDWSHRYKRTIEVLRSLKVKSAYLDGELCALNADLSTLKRKPYNRP